MEKVPLLVLKFGLDPQPPRLTAEERKKFEERQAPYRAKLAASSQACEEMERLTGYDFKLRVNV